MIVMLDKERNMSTLWRREEFLRICSKHWQDLAEKAQDLKLWGGQKIVLWAGPRLINPLIEETRF